MQDKTTFTNNMAKQTNYPEKQERSGKMKQLLLKVLLPLLTLIAGILLTFYLFITGPQAKILPKPQNATLVKTIPAQFGKHSISITAMGVVKPSQSINLKSQVSGSVIKMSSNFIPGGAFAQGYKLLQIDQKDYQLSLRQQKNAVSQAKNNLDIEHGNQIIAKRELDLLGEEVTAVEKKLMLRQPQLSNLNTELDIAQAKYEKAQLDLERTKISAPFNGIIYSREVNIGTWVSSSTTLATLVGTDSFWVEVSVPEDQLKWIILPDNNGSSGSLVKIHNPSSWGAENFREGRVIQLLPALESHGRMARILIKIDDPLSLTSQNKNNPKVLIDSFVRVSIEGKPIDSVLELTREYLHNGNKLWVFENDGTLGIREVSISFKNQENVLITSGITEGEELIVSNLSVPIKGMLLKKKKNNFEEKSLNITAKTNKNSQIHDTGVKKDS